MVIIRQDACFVDMNMTIIFPHNVILMMPLTFQKFGWDTILLEKTINSILVVFEFSYVYYVLYSRHMYLKI